MIVHVDISGKKTKKAESDKKKALVSSSTKKSYVHVESMSSVKEVESNPIRNIISLPETNVKEPLVEPYVESRIDSHVKPNVETYVPTSGKPKVEPHSKPIMDIHVFDTPSNDASYEDWSDVEIHHIETEVWRKNGEVKKTINTHVVDSDLNDNQWSNEEVRNEVDKDQEERNEEPVTHEEDNEDDDSHIANILKKIAAKKASQEPTHIALISLAKAIFDKAKGKEQKVDTPNPNMNIVKQKTPKINPLKIKKDGIFRLLL